VGALYVRQRTPIQWQQLGGGQEKNRRAGTENVAGVVGMAKALELAYAELEARNAHARALRDRLLTEVPQRIPHLHITGPKPKPAHPEEPSDGSARRIAGRLEGRAPNNASFCFEYLEGEAILIALDLAGIAASSGSACTSGSLEPSHVLTAMGVPEDLARGSLRLTVGKDNTPDQIKHVLEVLPGIVSRIRSLSPAWPERTETVS
jgi:cysteine desulfurase